jgi:hypothetical protein
MKIFISGRITGLPREEAARNFARGEREIAANDYTWVNPLDLVPEKTPNKEAMSILLPELLKCDGILLLNDTKFSEGSQIEEAVARYCGLQIFYEDDLN